MNDKAQKIAIPAFLRRRLRAFRVGQGKDQSYLVTDGLDGKTHRFEPWQFFVLEVLPGCPDFSKLSSVFEDRFGHPITNEEVEELFSMVADKKLFGLSAISHPMLASFHQKRTNHRTERTAEASLQGELAGRRLATREAAPESQSASAAAEKANTGSEHQRKSAADSGQEPLPAGVHDVLGFDDTLRLKGWKLFNPSGLLRHIQPALLPFKHTIYVLPFILAAALFVSINHADLIQDDLLRLRDSASFIEEVLFSMVTVNLMVTLVTGAVAYRFRATVSAFCIVFVMGFFPRFMVRVGHVQQLSRDERMWLHAAPLMARLGLFSVGLLLWYHTRIAEGFLASLGLGVAAVSALSLLLTANPLVKSSGYHLLAAFLNEPHLRGKSYFALLNKIRGNVYQKMDNNILGAYALASILFMALLFAVFMLVLGRFLKMNLGGAGVFLFVLLTLMVLLRMITKFKRIGELYERSVQFQRWRERTLPKAEEVPVEKENKSRLLTYLKRAALVLALAVLFVPYHYEPGGNFVILPYQQQELTAQVPGIIDEIYFDGGEFLKKGAVIARLSHSDYSAQVKIYSAKMQEQQAVINELKSRPRPEEVQLAERALKVEETRAQFSGARLTRLEKLYKQRTISYEDLDEARREHEIDLDQVEEKRAQLDLVKLGATPDQIAAAEAKLQSWQEQRDYHQEKIDQSVFYMPFDGRLITMHLKQKIGSYLDKGESLAVVENTEQVNAEIEVPEADISYVSASAPVRGRPLAYHEEDFTGVVTDIDANVIQNRSGKVVRVVTVLDNEAGRLRSGMTGYAKISGETLPLWRILSLAVVRFVKVEVWSWLP